MNLDVSDDTKAQIEKVIIVLQISDKRKNAELAALLYEETSESKSKSALQSIERKSMVKFLANNDGKPSKKDRRNILKIKKLENKSN